MILARWFKLALASGGLLGVGLCGGFGPLVRHEAAVAAERYGGTVAIERVAPTWRGARLFGVNVTLADVPSAQVHLDEVDVEYAASGRSVHLRGGRVVAAGERERVLREVESWRAHHASTAAGDAATRAGGHGVEVDGLAFRWTNAVEAPTEAVTASEIVFSREDGRVEVTAKEATVSDGRGKVAVKNGHLALLRRDQSYRVAELTADGLDAEITLSGGDEAAPTPAQVAPPAPAASHASAAPAASHPPPRAVQVANPPAAPAPAAGDAQPSPGATGVETLRAALLLGAKRVNQLLEPGATVRIAGVSARLHRRGEMLNLGPGTLNVTRAADRLVVELVPNLPSRPAAGNEAAPAPAAEGDEQALTFRLAVPLVAGGDDVVADVQGGPLWLSTLGVKDGDFGLFDVARTSIVTRSHLAFEANGARLSVDGEGKIHALSLHSAALSDQPVEGLELAWRGKGEIAMDGSHVQIDHAEVDLGDIRLLGRGRYQRVKDPAPAAADSTAPAFQVDATFEVPLTACQSMLASVPHGLLPKLQGMRMAGSFTLKGGATFDTTNLDHAYHLDWDTGNSCHIVEAPPSIQIARFRAPFTRTAYTPEGVPTQIEAGPGTPDWVPYGAISKFMEVAVLTTEDAGFRRHRGFDAEAIRNSLRENLRKRKFVRGASTISMQLAKNLYLDRTKNLSRKLQEAVLTMYLEQELTKEQILELYFNVVEFGPMVYGIGPAARYYFSASPAELSLGQSLYLSSIMPNPKVQRFGPGGAVTPVWTSYLRKLMTTAHHRQNITDEELEVGLRETVIRGSPAPSLEPRDPSRPQGSPQDGDLPPDSGEWIDP